MNTYRFYEQGGTHVLGTFDGDTLLGERTFNTKRLEAIEYQGKIDIKDKVTEQYILKEQVYTNILKEDGTTWGDNVTNSVIALNIFLDSIPYNISDLQDIPYPKVNNGYLKFQDGEYDWGTLSIPSPPPENTDFLSEGTTNLYFTEDRARDSVSATGSLNYDSNTGVFSYTQGDTDTVPEGTNNLYFTNDRADARILLANLDDLNNTDFVDVQGNQIISFNSTTSKWENVNLPISSPWTVNANSITYNSGFVGIGTTTPQSKLQVDGETIIGGGVTTGPVKLKILGTGDRGGSIRAYADAFGSTGLVFGLEGSAGGNFQFEQDVVPRGNLIYSLGNAGYAWSKVWAQKVTGRTNTAQGQLILNAGTTSNPIRFTIADTEHMRLNNDGKVGIGTTTPSEALHVVGKATINDGSNNVLISSGNSTITASNTTAVGYQALQALTTGGDNTAVGFQAGSTLTTESNNTLVGHQASATGNNGVAIGRNATVGTSGVAIGNGATATSTNNVAIGNGAKCSYESVAVGYFANAQGTLRNVAIGYSAASSTTGTLNHAIGYRTLRFTSGNHNTAVGAYALEGVSGASSFANSVAVGYQAGTALTTGSSNVLIGYQAGSTLTTESNRLFIANSNTTSPLIYGEFDNDLVRINGSFESTGGYGFGGQTASAVQTGYTPTNVTTTRSFDANSVTLDNLADVVGTLIEDLKTKGLISA